MRRSADGIAFEPTSARLLVGYSYVKGTSQSNVHGDGLAAYALGAGGGRTWTRSLQLGPLGASPERNAWVNSAGAEVKTDRLRITHTWIRTNGTWQILGGMSSPVNAKGQ